MVPQAGLWVSAPLEQPRFTGHVGEPGSAGGVVTSLQPSRGNSLPVPVPHHWPLPEGRQEGDSSRRPRTARDSPKGVPTRVGFPGLQVCALPPAWGPGGRCLARGSTWSPSRAQGPCVLRGPSGPSPDPRGSIPPQGWQRHADTLTSELKRASFSPGKV